MTNTIARPATILGPDATPQPRPERLRRFAVGEDEPPLQDGPRHRSRRQCSPPTASGPSAPCSPGPASREGRLHQAHDPLRHDDYSGSAVAVGTSSPSLVLTNLHDGTSAYKFFSGVFASSAPTA